MNIYMSEQKEKRYILGWIYQGGEGKMNKFYKRIIAVLSVAFLTTMASQVVSPILGEIKLSFPDTPDAAIKLIYAVVSLISIGMSFIVGTFVYRKKRALLFGIGCFIVGGIGCTLSVSFSMLLLFRCVTGIGAGMLSPIASSLIADFTKPQERTKYMGYNSFFVQLGSLISSALAGFIASYNWRFAFLLYGIGIISFILIAIWVPESTFEREDGKQEKKNREKLPGMVWFLAVFHFFFGAVFGSCYTNLSMGAAEYGITTKECGIAISMSALGAIIASIITPYLTKLFKKFTMPVIWIVISVLFYCMANATTAMQLNICMVLFGTFGGPMTIVHMALAVYGSNVRTSVKCTSAVWAAGMLGSFSCPFIFEFMGALFHNESTLFGFMVNGVEALIVAVLATFYFVVKKDTWKI
jgi:MFS family permease